MAPTRVLYAAQVLKIQTANSVFNSGLGVQSASCETNIPIEDLSVLSKLGSAGRFQKEVATCKSEIKIYATAGLGTIIAGLITDADAGTLRQIIVEPNGFQMSGILSSFSLDASKGDFVTASLGFDGIGEATQNTAPGSSLNSSVVRAVALAITPMTSAEVSVGGGAGCPASLKYSLDLPNETITCLGTVIAGDNAAIKAGSSIFSKPPFKSSLNVDGLNVDINTAIKSFTVTSCISVDITDGKIASKSFNQSAGDVGANYSQSVEGTSVTIS